MKEEEEEEKEGEEEEKKRKRRRSPAPCDLSPSNCLKLKVKLNSARLSLQLVVVVFAPETPRSLLLRLPALRMPEPGLLLEALSALSGCSVEASPAACGLVPQDFVNIVALREFYKQEGLSQLEYPSVGSVSLDRDDPDLEDLEDRDLYGPPPALTEGPGPDPGPRTTVKVNLQEFFHPEFDYDFTSVRDGDRKFLRGNEPYVRPVGWNRVALRVQRRYDGGDAWLGTGGNAWPVSYQGHGMDGSLGVILTRTRDRDPDQDQDRDPDQDPAFLDAAADSLLAVRTRGRGVYSTPDVALAEKFCKKFKSKVDGKTYKVVLQNRINPERRTRCQRDGVWLVYVPEGSTDLQMKAIVQEAVRPYGLLLKAA